MQGQSSHTIIEHKLIRKSKSDGYRQDADDNVKLYVITKEADKFRLKVVSFGFAEFSELAEVESLDHGEFKTLDEARNLMRSLIVLEGI
jgi:hypothetical protein